MYRYPPIEHSLQACLGSPFGRHNIFLPIYKLILQRIHTHDTVRYVDVAVVGIIHIILAFGRHLLQHGPPAGLCISIFICVISYISMGHYFGNMPEILFLCAVGGIGFGLDAQATALLKNFFQRARPSDLHHSFSFPSGHSTSVYFIVGFLFFIIMPAVYETLTEDVQQGSPEATKASSVATGNRALQALEAVVRPQNAAALTIMFGAITQSGRLLADVHWTSDVMAGMMWGATGVAIACILRDTVYKLADMQSGTAAAGGSRGQRGSKAE